MFPEAVDEVRDTGTDDGTVDDHGRVPHGSTDDPWLVDFSANTNPRIPEGVPRVYESALATARRYPSDDYCAFRVAAAEVVDCEAHEVIPTAGGLATIRLTLQTTVQPGDSVLVPAPSFGEYAREVRLQGAEPTFADHDAVLDADPVDHELVVVCNPNNPTGECYDHDRLRAFAERCRDVGTTLLVDEAFLGFTDQSSLAGTPGVVVARSLTKLYGLPGLRAGYAVATGRHRDRLDTARITWSLGGPAAAVGTHCLRDEAFVAATKERVRTERERMRTQLSGRFRVYPSDAPFLLLELDAGDSVDELLDNAREYDIAIRDARTFRGLDSHVRVAVRMPDENQQLLGVLDLDV
jgi:histidinol-phosphate aminotransferase/threonine-phosphate decarboxylase